jgi:MFS family permease
MRSVIAPITALLLSNALLLMGNGLQGILLPIRGGLEAFSPLDLGILGGVYFLGFGAGCLHGARLIGAVGHIRVFAAMVAIVSANALVHPLALSPLVWWLLRGATGYCFAVLFMVIESWLNERSTPETRGSIFSLYTIVNLTVITLGQLMLPFGNPSETALFSIVSILISLAAVPVTLSRAAAPAPVQAVRVRPFHIYRVSPVGFMGCLVVGLVNGSFWSLSPVFAQQIGANTTGVAIFMSSTVIAGALGQWPLGRLSDRIDRRKVIFGACVLAAAAGIGLTIFQDRGPSFIFPFAWAYGFFSFALYAISVAHTNDFVDPRDYVETSSSLLLLYAIGAVIGPPVAAAIMGFRGPGGLFLFAATCLAALAAFAFWRLSQRERPPEEDRADFADSIRLAQTVAAVEPLSEDLGTEQSTEIAGHEDELVPGETESKE